MASPRPRSSSRLMARCAAEACSRAWSHRSGPAAATGSAAEGCLPLGGGDDRSGVIERIAPAQAIESFGDEPLSALDGEASVEAAFDVEGEAEPGVAGCGHLGDGPSRLVR